MLMSAQRPAISHTAMSMKANTYELGSEAQLHVLLQLSGLRNCRLLILPSSMFGWYSYSLLMMKGSQRFSIV